MTAGGRFSPIVRQQFSFSPSGATHEVENYNVSLKGASELELHIVADVSDGLAWPHYEPQAPLTLTSTGIRRTAAWYRQRFSQLVIIW